MENVFIKVSVHERLPEKEGYYFAIKNGELVGLLLFDKTDVAFYEDFDRILYIRYPTHWLEEQQAVQTT